MRMDNEEIGAHETPFRPDTEHAFLKYEFPI